MKESNKYLNASIIQGVLIFAFLSILFAVSGNSSDSDTLGEMSGFSVAATFEFLLITLSIILSLFVSKSKIVKVLWWITNPAVITSIIFLFFLALLYVNGDI